MYVYLVIFKLAKGLYVLGFSYFRGVNSFQDSDYDKFSLLYRLLQKVDKLEICAKYFTKFVKVSVVDGVGLLVLTVL